MANNWRLEIKRLFANMLVAALGDELEGFSGWNSQLINFDTEETSAQMQVYFEYSDIGESITYAVQRDIQQAVRIPVTITLHVTFDDYTEHTQDQAYDFADKINCVIQGTKNALICGKILKIGEEEDTNHRAKYDYRLLYQLEVFEAVGVEILQPDSNPEDGTNPETGRRLITEIDASFEN